MKPSDLQDTALKLLLHRANRVDTKSSRLFTAEAEEGEAKFQEVGYVVKAVMEYDAFHEFRKDLDRAGLEVVFEATRFAGTADIFEYNMVIRERRSNATE